MDYLEDRCVSDGDPMVVTIPKTRDGEALREDLLDDVDLYVYVSVD